MNVEIIIKINEIFRGILKTVQIFSTLDSIAILGNKLNQSVKGQIKTLPHL